MTVPTAPEIIRLEDVRKEFRVRRDNSLKDRIVHFGRLGRTHREEFVAVNDVTLEIHAGTTVGLMGANGSGKSTLLKLIGGIVSPTSGRVLTRGRMAALLELGAGFHPDLSGRENVYLNASILGLSREEIDERFDDIVEFSGIREFIDTAVKFYSSGMYVRLAFSVAVHTDPDILLVDEVLAVGDEAFQRRCMDRIARFREEGCTIILVTHSAQQVAELCDRGIVMSHGAVVFDGPTEPAIGVLRDVLEGRYREDGVSPPLLVRGVEVRGPDGMPARELASGEPFTVRLRLRADQEVRSWAAGFSINTTDGHMVFAANTQLIEYVPPPVKGETHLDLEIRDIRLGQGQYHIHANAVTSDPVGDHGVAHAATFFVTTDVPTLGSAFGRVVVRGTP